MPDDDPYESANFLFSNRLTNFRKSIQKQKFKCGENFERPNDFKKYKDKVVEKNEWYRGVEIFNVSASFKRNYIKTFTFETDINFVRAENSVHDIFNVKLQPFSESFSVLFFVYKPSEEASSILLPTGITNLDRVNDGIICLRKPVRGVMEIN